MSRNTLVSIILITLVILVCASSECDTPRDRRVISKRALIVALVVALLTVCVWRHFEMIRRYPRGPFPLPFIGNLLEIDTSYPYRSMIKWQKRYGSVFTIWLPKPVVVVAEWNELQKILLGSKGEHCLDRPQSYVYGIFMDQKPGGDGIILSSGAVWRAQRRFALSALKTFGMGGARMEARINRHKDALISRISDAVTPHGENKHAKGGYGSASAADASFHFFASIDSSKCSAHGTVIENVHEQLAFCFGNIIHDLVMGRHYEFNDPEFLRFKHLIDNTLETVSSVPFLIIDCYPWTRFFFPSYFTYLREGYEIQRFFFAEIDAHASRLDVNTTPTNFIDAYLQDMHARDDMSLSNLTLVLNSGDLWTGGLETVVTTLTWAIIYLIHYPHVQRTLQTELDTVLEGRAFRMIDRQRLPYLRATIDELQRIVNVLPWHIPHAVDETVKLSDHIIPKGATVMPQFGAVHLNPELFPDPETFRPERFLKPIDETQDQNPSNGPSKEHQKIPSWKYVPSEHFAPFGIGKRACLGEGLARMELHVVFAALVQNFYFESADEDKPPTLARQPGMTSKPHAFTCRVARRHSRLVLRDSNP